MAAGVRFSSLMEAAGSAVAEALAVRWSPRAVTVLCGPGNNGGDGLVAARRLAQAGWPVKVAVGGAREQWSPALQAQVALWSGPVEPLTEAVLVGAALVVDALFGAGLNRPLAPAMVDLLAAAARCKLDVVAVDVPSGLQGDTAQDHGAIAARLTVTFFRRKPAHVLPSGRALCGDLVVADIGIPESVITPLGVDTFAIGPDLFAQRPPGGLRLAAAGTPAWQVISADHSAPIPDVLSLARRRARALGKVVILGGSDPVIAAPDGAALIHPVMVPAMPVDALRALLQAQLACSDSGSGPTCCRLAAALWKTFPAPM